jgi:outer membrane lipoprotein-sorting protein
MVASLLAALTGTASADKSPDATELMQKVESRDIGKDMTANHALMIIPKGGTKRVRSYSLMRKETKDVVKLVTFFSAPTDVRGAAFMVWDNKSSDDQRWIYLPAVGQVRRLVVGDARQSFFGSDFVFEDFTNRDPDQDTHKLVGSQKVDGWDCWVIESKPKNTRGLDFASYKSWVWKGKDMLIRQELMDGSGKVVRRMQAVKIGEIQGIQTYLQITVQNPKTGSESRAEIKDVKYNVGVADERFDESQLQRGAN